MKIDKVTITGADDKTERAELYALWQHYPFVEWGVLFSKSKEATPRYPSRTKILEFAAWGMPLSAHFCGWHSREVMEGNNFRLVEELPQDFKRIQINYNFHKSDGWQIKGILEWAYNHPERAIIFQYNQSNAAACELMMAKLSSDNIHFLYDSSGGRGTAIDEIRPPFRTYTGYSGGIHPDNIHQVAQKIYKNRLKYNVWIDMESGVRTENEFDTDKVGEVLEICQSYMQPKEENKIL